MRFIVPTNSREDFFNIGRAIGGFFKDHAEQRQRRIIINGKMNGGKSVIGFGVDEPFRPERYKHGLEADRIVDKELKRKVGEDYVPPVFFINYAMGNHAMTDTSVSRLFANISRDYNKTKILIISNLGLHHRFNHQNGWLERSNIDIGIIVPEGPENDFNADIVIDTVGHNLTNTLAQIGLPKSSAPHPPA